MWADAALTPSAMRLEQRAAGAAAPTKPSAMRPDAGRAQKLGDDRIPLRLTDLFMQRVVGDEFRIALAQRHEEQHATLAVGWDRIRAANSRCASTRA